MSKQEKNVAERGRWLRGSRRRKENNGRESWGERGKREKWENGTWATVTISPRDRGDERQERLSDKTAHIKAVRRNKSRVAASPSVAESHP